MYSKLGVVAAAALVLTGLFGTGEAMAQANCPVKIGGILPLTGSMGPVAAKISQSAQLAIEHINAGGGVKGCPVQFILRDDQGQSSVGVDAAKYLVEVERVQAFTGTISSGVSGPIISAVTAPSKVVQVSCCTSASAFTLDGRSNGYFFRTLPTAKTQAYALAAESAARGMKRTAVIYLNNDFGIDLLKLYKVAFAKMGGQIIAEVPYNDNQPSYRAEVTKALAEKPESLMLIAFPKDGVTIVREWLSFGGTPMMELSNANRVKDFVDGVGAKFLANASGVDSGQVEGPTVDSFNKLFQAKYNVDSKGPGVHSQYDALIMMALAMNIAKEHTGTAIRDSMRLTHAAGGTVVGTGPDEYKKALALIKDGKPIKYVGATGPLEFDANGDVTGPILVWNVKENGLGVGRTYTIDDMSKLFKQVDG